MAGLTRKSSGYNPLGDAHKVASLGEVWVCVAPGAAFREAPSPSAAIKEQLLKINMDAHPSDGAMYETVPVNTELMGKREGDWIQVADTDAYVPVKDPENGTRYFKNKRLHMFEADTTESDAPMKRPSQISVASSKKSGNSEQGCDLM